MQTEIQIATSDVGLLAAFGGGMISFLSPCVLPLVPGYLSLLSGVSASDLVQGAPTGQQRRRVLLAALGFVVGFTIIFTLLGATASSIGSVLQDHKRGLEQFFGLLVIIMGLFLLGIFPSSALLRERRVQLAPKRFGMLAAPIAGMAFAFGWTPCIGPILSGVLSAAASSDTVGRGVVLLLAYSLGLGVPFLLSALALHRLRGLFGWVKRHYRAINFVSGAILLAFGYLLFTNQVGWLAGRVTNFLDRVGLDFLLQI